MDINIIHLNMMRVYYLLARAKDKDSGGSQFFIVTKEASNLDGSYAGFGKVIEGLVCSSQNRKC